MNSKLFKAWLPIPGCHLFSASWRGMCLLTTSRSWDQQKCSHLQQERQITQLRAKPLQKHWMHKTWISHHTDLVLRTLDRASDQHDLVGPSESETASCFPTRNKSCHTYCPGWSRTTTVYWRRLCARHLVWVFRVVLKTNKEYHRYKRW